jgi:hypothetical protein
LVFLGVVGAAAQRKLGQCLTWGGAQVALAEAAAAAEKAAEMAALAEAAQVSHLGLFDPLMQLAYEPRR